jgi:hypothetical protein
MERGEEEGMTGHRVGIHTGVFGVFGVCGNGFRVEPLGRRQSWDPFFFLREVETTLRSFVLRGGRKELPQRLAGHRRHRRRKSRTRFLEKSQGG